MFFSQRGDVGGWGGAGSRRKHGPEENQGPGNAKQGREQAEPRMAKHGKKLGGRRKSGQGQSRLFRAEAGEKASGSCQSRLCAGSTIKTELCV